AGTAAEPLAPTARVVELESKVPIELEQALSLQTWKVTLPVSCVSGSLNVALSVGVAVLSCDAFAGLTSTGVVGVAFVVEFVIEAFVKVAVTAAFPVGTARSRTIGFAPGLV